jgi:A/G-specific adenine glycosylase
LWQLAQVALELPRDPVALQKLPGIGPYTAGALAAFAFNQPVTLIETNVRTVFLYHFFPGQTAVSDAELLPLIAATTPTEQARIWYAALMDYGSYLKSVLPNPSRQSKHHTQQSRFQGSARQVRGELLRLLLKGEATKTELLKQLTSNVEHFETALAQLLKEQLIVEKNQRYHIA